jgi:hypothetical protein
MPPVVPSHAGAVIAVPEGTVTVVNSGTRTTWAPVAA